MLVLRRRTSTVARRAVGHSTRHSVLTRPRRPPFVSTPFEHSHTTGSRPLYPSLSPYPSSFCVNPIQVCLPELFVFTPWENRYCLVLLTFCKVLVVSYSRSPLESLLVLRGSMMFTPGTQGSSFVFVGWSRHRGAEYDRDVGRVLGTTRSHKVRNFC